MNTFPLWARVLEICGVDPSVIGDLEEAAQSGRSRCWCWRQAIGILLLGPAPPSTVAWLLIAIVFIALTMMISGPFVTLALESGQWTPFHAIALLCGYGMFALFARAVRRVCQHKPRLILHTTRLALFTLLWVMVVQLWQAAALFAEVR